MQTSLGNKEIPNYYQWLNQQTHTFIRHLVQSPSEYTKHIRRYAGGLTLAVVYGYHVTSSNDEYLMLAEECLDLLSNRISGGGLWLVDIFPFLKYIPSWLPGAGFKSEAEVFRRKYEKFAEAPYRYAKIASVRISSIVGGLNTYRQNSIGTPTCRRDSVILRDLAPGSVFRAANKRD